MGNTVGALATPAGTGAIGLIRVSGPDAFFCVSQCLPKALDVSSFPDRKAILTKIIDSKNQIIDEVLLIRFSAPKSYTGEHCVEISCHGGILICKRILNRLLETGIQAAGPGEFSQRAFLNGKMDLTQAEAVMDLISAQTELALRSAHEQLAGSLGEKTDSIRNQILSMLAHIEAYIDFPDEEIENQSKQSITNEISKISSQIKRLLQTAEQGRILREGVRTVIIGAPNVGKSSLLNQLLGYDRAIVSNIEGTTRDTIEEVLNLKGIPLRLIDTAGLRQSEDLLEKSGIQRAQEQLKTADLVLEVIDATQAKSQSWKDTNISRQKHQHHLLVINKCDLSVHSDWRASNGIHISSLTGEGFDVLSDAIAQELCLSENTWGEHSVAVNLRHQACLMRADKFLKHSEKLLNEDADVELVAMELREAMDAVGEIAGRVDTEDILGEIFTNFCIGK